LHEERRNRQMGKTTIPSSEKYLRWVEEAARYLEIVEGKIRTMIRNSPGGLPDWILMNGTKTMIKRAKFERFLDSVTVI